MVQVQGLKCFHRSDVKSAVSVLRPKRDILSLSTPPFPTVLYRLHLVPSKPLAIQGLTSVIHM